MGVLILSEKELRQCVDFDDVALTAIETGFSWLAAGKVDMPPILHVQAAKGDVDVKSAYVEGIEGLAVKIASGFFDNPDLGLPSSSAMMVVLNASTGIAESVLFDNGYLTDLRTGLAGSVAAKHLAPQSVTTVGIVGTGVQARYQLRALRLAREFSNALVWGRRDEAAATYAEDMAAELGISVTPRQDLERLVGDSQVVVTTTAAEQPLIEASWLHPGLHITAIGADLPGKQELAPELLAKCDHLVCDSVPQCEIGGEYQHATGMVDRDAVKELGAVVSGEVAGRTNEHEVTVCDLTGTGMQDTVIADLALRNAKIKGFGKAL